MSQENVEIMRQSYAAYNAALSAPNPREAIRAWLERFADPEVEWDAEPTAIGSQIVHGIDGVMEFFDEIFDAFEQVRQVPERFIDCGEQVLVFVRSEARGRVAGLEGGPRLRGSRQPSFPPPYIPPLVGRALGGP